MSERGVKGGRSPRENTDEGKARKGTIGREGERDGRWRARERRAR